LLKVLTYLGIFDRDEEEENGNYIWTFKFNENIENQIPFDEIPYIKSISTNFIIEFKKEPHKTVAFNLDNQVCGFAILQSKECTFAMKTLAIIIGRAPLSPEE